MTTRTRLELAPRTARIVTLIAALSVLSIGGAVAYAQTGGTAGDTVVGLALSSLRSTVTVLQAQVGALQAADHVDRATLSTAGSVVTQNGRWIARVDHPFPGNYVVTFAPGAFSAPPTCVLTALASEATASTGLGGPALIGPIIACYPPTPSSVTCQARGERGGGFDTAVSVICVGP